METFGNMETFAELIGRLLEIQSGGRQKGPKLLADDEQPILRKRSFTEKPIPKSNRSRTQLD